MSCAKALRQDGAWLVGGRGSQGPRGWVKARTLRDGNSCADRYQTQSQFTTDSLLPKTALDPTLPLERNPNPSPPSRLPPILPHRSWAPG